MTQRQLGELSGGWDRTVSYIENRKRGVNVSTLIRIAEALDCELEIRFKERSR